jgi:hypothetical protein
MPNMSRLEFALKIGFKERVRGVFLNADVSHFRGDLRMDFPACRSSQIRVAFAAVILHINNQQVGGTRLGDQKSDNVEFFSPSKTELPSAYILTCTSITNNAVLFIFIIPHPMYARNQSFV